MNGFYAPFYKNDELEFMSTICKYYNDSNLVEYAKRMYQNLTD